MIEITGKGEFKKTKDFLNKIRSRKHFSELDHFGRMGVEALSDATPEDTRITSGAWDYRIINDRQNLGIEWFNTNDADGTPIVILIQYGHATGTGGYVQGRDFINPAMKPVFDKISNNIWKKVIA